MQKTALGYIRKSVIRDDDPANSPARQRAAIERWVGDRYALEFYEDLDISGRREDNRPGWQRLLGRLDDPDVAAVCVESLDRCYRNRTEFGQFKARLESLNKELVILNMQGVDGTTAAGNLFLGIQAEVAEFESRIASERMIKTITHIKQNDRRHIGCIPFGCDRDSTTKHLIPSERAYYYNPETGHALAADPDAVPPSGYEERRYHDALHRLFERFATGNLSLQQTADSLNADGWLNWSQRRTVPTDFQRNTVQSIVRRWYLYAGLLPDGDQFEQAGHDVILPPALCHRVAATIQNHAVGWSPRREQETYILSGVLHCAECGVRLVGTAYRNKYFYYKHNAGKRGCSQRAIPKDDLDGQVIQALAEFVQTAPVIEALHAEHEAEARTAAGPNPARAELEQKQAEMERLIDIYQAGPITREQFDSRYARLQADIKALETRLAPPPALDADCLDLVGDPDLLAETEPGLLKQIIRATFEHLEVRDREIIGAKVHPEIEGLIDRCDDNMARYIIPTLTIARWQRTGLAG